MSEFFSMGGYAGFVWPAYLITAAGILWMIGSSVSANRRTKRALDAAQAGRKRN